MQRWIAAIVGSMLVAFGAAAPATAQTQPALVGGGLTSLPTPIYTDILANGGFETLSGSTPANWTPSGTWNVDQLVKRTGSYS
jgi:hypothetical protein